MTSTELIEQFKLAFTYDDPFVINPAIIEDKAGDVVTAERWQQLWSLVIAQCNDFAATFTAVKTAMVGVVTYMSEALTTVESGVATVAGVVDAMTAIQDTTIATAEAAADAATAASGSATAAAGSAAQAVGAVTGAVNKYVWYGEEAPTDPHCKFWYKPDGEDTALTIQQAKAAAIASADAANASFEFADAARITAGIASDLAQGHATAAANSESAAAGYASEAAITVETHNTSATVHEDKFALKADKADTSLLATNLVTNGDFSNGTTGWTVTNATLSVSSNILTITATSTSQTLYQYIPIIAGHKYCFKFTVCQSGVFPDTARAYLVSDVITYITNNTSVQNITKFYTATTSGNLIFQIMTYAPVGATINLSYCSSIDLTKDFCNNVVGTDKEPTTAQMNYLLSYFPNSWFNGTANLFTAKMAMDKMIALDNLKADKAQEAWITPTLLNGWTGLSGRPPQYRKNSIGEVETRGIATGGTANTAMFQFAIGHRSSASYTFPVYTNAGFGAITIDVNATQLTGGTTNVQLNGIRFKAEA